MPETIDLICITCPKGCTLHITREGETILDVDAGCKRGHHYAAEELLDPRRMIASTVKVLGGQHPLLPVYTREPFPKPRIQELMTALRQVEIEAPVRMGEIVLPNALGTGIDIIASRDME
jgi:CxxC motif-containing protein